jgi:hypothetical protein
MVLDPLDQRLEELGFLFARQLGGIVQSGGPTALINASACGVIQGAGKHRDTTDTHAAALGSCRCKVKGEGCEPRVNKHLATGKVYFSIGICVSEM